MRSDQSITAADRPLGQTPSIRENKGHAFPGPAQSCQLGPAPMNPASVRLWHAGEAELFDAAFEPFGDDRTDRSVPDQADPTSSAGHGHVGTIPQIDGPMRSREFHGFLDLVAGQGNSDSRQRLNRPGFLGGS